MIFCKTLIMKPWMAQNSILLSIAFATQFNIFKVKSDSAEIKSHRENTILVSVMPTDCT